MRTKEHYRLWSHYRRLARFYISGERLAYELGDTDCAAIQRELALHADASERYHANYAFAWGRC